MVPLAPAISQVNVLAQLTALSVFVVGLVWATQLPAPAVAVLVGVFAGDGVELGVAIAVGVFVAVLVGVVVGEVPPDCWRMAPPSPTA
jgi:hypothetical protein